MSTLPAAGSSLWKLDASHRQQCRRPQDSPQNLSCRRWKFYKVTAVTLPKTNCHMSRSHARNAPNVLACTASSTHITLVRSAAITRHTSTPFLRNCNVRAPPLQAGSVLLLLLLLTQGYPAGTVVTAAAALPQQWLFCLRLDPIKIYLPLVSLTPRKHHTPHTHC